MRFMGDVESDDGKGASHEGHNGHKVCPLELYNPFVHLRDRCARSSAGVAEFIDGVEVMVVVFGHEETKVDDGHGLAQPRV